MPTYFPKSFAALHDDLMTHGDDFLSGSASDFGKRRRPSARTSKTGR